MTVEQLEELFQTHENEFLEWEKVTNKLSQRTDLHVFIKLDQMCPSNLDIVAYAEHNEFFLSVSLEELAQVATEDDIIELIRCGVRLSCDNGLCMYT